MRKNMKGFTLIELLLVLAILAIVVLIAATPWIAAYAWNWVMPDLFGLKKITAWEAFKLVLVISSFLAGALGICEVGYALVSLVPLSGGELSQRIRARKTQRKVHLQQEFNSWHNRTN